MNEGSRELTRAVTVYLACLAFVLAFLVATFTGSSLWTCVVRGAVVAVATLVIGRMLMGPVLSAILDAMARDRGTGRTGDAS